MSEIIDIAGAAARGIELPSGAAQDILDEQEAWLARRIGPLVDERTETFWVGLSATCGKLSLARYTDEVDVVDAGSTVSDAFLRLVDNGSAIVRSFTSPTRYWTGPYVEVSYTPTDEDEVRRALYDLVALAAAPPGPFDEEQIGSYRYRRSTAGNIPAHRAAIAASLLPKRDPALTLRALPSRTFYGLRP